MSKQNNKMVRLHFKEKTPERGEYADIERIDFLINKNQKFVTGQNIAVDGGRTIV